MKHRTEWSSKVLTKTPQMPDSFSLITLSFLLSLSALLQGCGGVTSTTTLNVNVNTSDGEPVSEVMNWGKVDGKNVEVYTLANTAGTVCKIMNYGATVTELHLPGKNGEMADIAHGYNDLQGYLDGTSYFGAMVGRVANRIGKASFELDGQKYTLATNNGQNHLHGGIKGLDKVVWDAVQTGNRLSLTHVSPDGDEGYPGAVSYEVAYELTDANELRIEMKATADKNTPVNLAHHSYWNLGGTASGLVLDHELQLHCAKYTVFDPEGIPTGEIAAVAESPLDFTTAKSIGKDIGEIPAGGDNPGGYDHNFVVDGEPGTLRVAARVTDPVSGRTMEISSTQPGIQFYTGNYMDGSTSGKGATHAKQSAFCLETQHFPDSINQPSFPSCVVGPDKPYHEIMVHAFSVEK